MAIKHDIGRLCEQAIKTAEECQNDLRRPAELDRQSFVYGVAIGVKCFAHEVQRFIENHKD